jgi:hypothetical protein
MKENLLLIFASFLLISSHAQEGKLSAGVGQSGVVIIYEGPLPLPADAQLIRTGPNGPAEWKFQAARNEREVREKAEAMPEVFRYVLPMGESAFKELAGKMKTATQTSEIPFFNVTTIAFASGLAHTDPEGNMQCIYRLKSGNTWLTGECKPASSGAWTNYRAEALGQTAQQEQARLGWYIPPAAEAELQGVVAYRGKPFGEAIDPLYTLRGFMRQNDSLVATVRDTTTHIVGSWHYAVRMVNRFGAISPFSELILAHNYPPGSRPWFSEFRATGSKTAPTITLTWKVENAVRVKAVHIYRSRKPDGPFEIVHSAPASVTEFVDHVYDVMEAYFYYIHVEDVAGDPDIRTVVYPAVCEFRPEALPVSEITADSIAGNVVIRWKGNGAPDRGYYVMRTEGYADSLLKEISPFIPAVAGKADYEYVDADSTLRGDRHYTYAVITESHGYVKSGVLESVSIRPNRKLYVPSPNQIHLRREDNGSDAMLTWSHVSNKEYDRHFGYRVFTRVAGTSEPFADALDRMVMLDTNWLLIRNVRPDQEFVVRAVDIYGNQSAFTMPVKLEDPFYDSFGPRYLRAERKSQTQSELRWNIPPDARVSGFQLYQTNGESEPVLVGKFSAQTTNTQVTNPSAGTYLYYFIVALDATGKPSTPSEWVRVGE